MPLSHLAAVRSSRVEPYSHSPSRSRSRCAYHQRWYRQSRGYTSRTNSRSPVAAYTAATAQAASGGLVLSQLSWELSANTQSATMPASFCRSSMARICERASSGSNSASAAACFHESHAQNPLKYPTAPEGMTPSWRSAPAGARQLFTSVITALTARRRQESRRRSGASPPSARSR